MDLIDKDDFSKATRLEKFKLHALSSPLMKLFKIDEVNKIYAKYKDLSGIDFITKTLEELEISYEINEKDLKNIPSEGAFIAIANHPYGGIDGLIFLKIMAEKRPDFKIMANFLLQKLEPLSDYILPVNPFEDIAKDKNSLAGIKQTLNSLQNGNPIGIFPAGEVSSFQANSRLIIDRQWSPMVGKIAKKAQIPVVPIHFSGNNSYLFNLLGIIHPLFRTAKLPSELFNKKGTTIKVRIGKPIPVKNFNEFEDMDLLTDYLRARTYAISNPLEFRKIFKAPRLLKKKVEDIIPAIKQDLIAAEVDSLRDSSNHLFTHENFEVFVAFHNQIPNILKELGRLREITFRAVGEGTNKSIDLDKYDIYYHHLFIFDKVEKCIVGAYRIGKGNDILRKYSKKGFYLNSLFKMSDDFLPYLNQSLEMGRSFIRVEYQQRHQPLFLLWKGILSFLKQNQEYRYLIGPVSISSDFSKNSKILMVEFIKKHYFDYQLAEYIKPAHEFKLKSKSIDTDLLIKNDKNALKNLDDLVSQIEPFGQRIPVLVKKYLKQDAKIIGFNVDPDFNNSLDGFIILDAKNIPSDTIEMLERS